MSGSSSLNRCQIAFQILCYFIYRFVKYMGSTGKMPQNIVQHHGNIGVELAQIHQTGTVQQGKVLRCQVVDEIAVHIGIVAYEIQLMETFADGINQQVAQTEQVETEGVFHQFIIIVEIDPDILLPPLFDNEMVVADVPMAISIGV